MIEVSFQHAFADFPADIAFRSEARALALFGDSGAGKTTVLNAIAGLLRPKTGRIVLDSDVLFDSAKNVWRPPLDRRVGYVFQDGRLFPHLSTRGNLLYGARSRGIQPKDADAVIALLDLGSLLSRRPASLSGGEKQRVAIGRALLSDPRILLLDEPLTGLHLEARSQVLGYLRRLREELRIATILVSHQPEEVTALADDVVLIRSGIVVDHFPADRMRS